MKRSKFSETQIIKILKEQELGLSVKEITRKYGICSATFYNWKSKYGGMEANQLVKLRELEAENTRLKQLYANMSLENYALKDLIEKKL